MSNDPTLEPRPEDYAELAALARTISLSDTHLDSPPDDLWRAIESRVAAGEPAPARAVPADELDARRAARSRRLSVSLGAAAAVVAAIVGLVAFVGRDDGLPGTRVEEVALSNEGLEAIGASSRATATLVRTADGSFALDIAASTLPNVSDRFFELWIIDPNIAGMYSLGPLHGDGRYVLPEHVDPAAFPIIDVSIEPTDGAPAHSGKSILRGRLTA